ncbi:cation diffusion facilitator family transporter [Pacificimonas flava]|uniref:Protein p34 n=1 Tax=Pacificimonas flava TaxID=1234595 RepID=M2TMT5_9SPHN|nr:cation diffusion facilitator family transporter [Pacificimonas flava]EMD83041.1 Cobalt-zinc-cadmium resistance protein [Pacificimonas flava]MBB5280198.1 ferrous-iron efflux pump FieF [Pacificimonas flava]
MTRRAARASIAAAAVLMGAKAWASHGTGSVAMLGSLADTALDLAASIFTFFAVRVAAEPADEEHRFGHGKAEAIAALVQTVLIFLSAAVIVVRAAVRLARGETGQVTAPALGIGVSLFAILVTLALVLYQRSVIRRTGSLAIESDRLHYQSDLLLNLAVIGAFALEVQFGLSGADAGLGVLIAVWLGWSAWGTGRRATDMLMDREWPELKRQQLLNLVTELPDVDGIHELRTRRAGHQDFAQFHIWVDPDLSVATAHEIAERAERAVLARFPGTEVLIHVDPRGHVDVSEIEESHFCPIAPSSAT